VKITDKRWGPEYPLTKQYLLIGRVYECDCGIFWRIYCGSGSMVDSTIWVKLGESTTCYTDADISQGKCFREVDAELVIRSKGDE